MDSDSAHMMAATKVPMLKPGVTTLMPITSVEDKAQRRLEVKARSTLMMGIPNEHQLKFNSIKDAKQLMEAIENRFEWNTHAVVWRNKADLDTMSMDDLYNNLKVYESEVKGMSSSNSSTQNVAFVSSSNNNNTNGAVNTAQAVNTALGIHPDDSEEMDLRWQMAMLTMRARRSPKSQDTKHKESTKRTVPVETPASTALVSCDGLGGYDWSDQAKEGVNYALMAYTSTSSDSKVSTDSTCTKSCLETVKILKSQNEQLTKDLKKSELMVLGYKSGLESIEERLKFFKTNESVYLEDIKLLKVKIQMKDIAIKELRTKLEVAQKEKEGIQLTAEKLENASKSLNKLIDCQIIDNCKKRLGYKSYNAVPPSCTGNFMPLKPDLSYSGLDEFTVKPVVKNKFSEDETKAVRKNPDAPIVEYWVLDDEEENVTQPKIVKKTIKPILVNTARQVSTAQPKSTVNVARPKSYLSKTTHSTVKRPIHKKTSFNNSNVNQMVNTVRSKTVNTAGPKAIVNAVQGNVVNAVKASAWNMSYLRYYEEINEGYVAFGGNPKGKKITGKFNSKADEGFFIGYSINSKAFRVFNSRKRIVEENLHIKFSENTPNVVVSGPDWLFDIDALTRTMNYEPIATGTQSNGFAVGAVVVGSVIVSIVTDTGNTNNVNAASTNGANAVSENISNELPFDPNMPALEDISTFNFSSDHEDDDEEADMNNIDTTIQNKKDERGIVIRNKARLVARGHIQEEGIDYDEVFSPVAKIEAIRLFLAYASFKDFVVYQMDVKRAFLYGKIKKEVYVYQPPVFEDPNFPDKVYKVEKALYGLHQAPKAWYKTLSIYLLDNGFHKGNRQNFIHQKAQSQDKYVAEILKKYGFIEVKNASTPIETHKPLLKDEDGKEVDVHMYRSMIGSLMYLTSSMHDIIFVVCACARYRVNPKVSNLDALKRIFSTRNRQWLQIPQQKLNMWLLQVVVDKYSGFKINYMIMGETVIGKVQLQALVDGKKVIITESTVRRDLKLEDAKSVDCLPNAAIFKQLTLMGKTKRKDTELPQTSGPTTNVADEAVNKEMNDSLRRVATNAYSLEAKQDSELCTNLQNRVFDLENTKTTQAIKIDSLIRRVKKLEKKQRSRTHKLKRLYKVGLTARVKSSDDNEDLGEDASKQGKIRKKIKDLKNKSFDPIQKMFEKAFKRVNTFKPISLELLEESSKKAKAEVMEGSSKRARTKLEQESSKKQKIDDDKETTELKQIVKIIPDEEGVAIDAIPLAVKPPSIVD
nr:hypothetical protein [Tanacetum cinerariifolium]